jgi:misacylated tRNA(Ala) deacylase
MTVLLHMEDNYVRRFAAEIVEALQNGIVLDRTAFYPLGGGVQNDIGMIVAGGKKYDVVDVQRIDGKVVHVLNKTEGLKKGQKVNGEIDWNRRYKLMRLHTAAHLLSAVIFKKTGALIGSGRVDIESTYLGFTLENPDKALIEEVVKESNEMIDAGAEVTLTFEKREDALKNPETVRLAEKMPPEVDRLRIVTIAGIDRQACGGPHVANLDEIGRIEIVRMENKGKGNRRLYYTVI